MGHHNSQPTLRQQINQLSLIKQNPQQRLYMHPHSQQEYMVVNRLIHPHENHLIQTLRIRKTVDSRFVPKLIQYGETGQSYCSDVIVMEMLFMHPAKSLEEQITSRESLGQWFAQGQIMMMAYCVLVGLQGYQSMGQTYQVHVNEGTLFVDIQGNIVLSDVDNFKEKPSRNSMKKSVDSVHATRKNAMNQLGSLIHRIIQINSENCSASVKAMANSLKFGHFNTFQQALNCLNSFKNDEGPLLPPQQKKNEVRVVLGERTEDNHNGIKSVCYMMSRKKKESNYQAYKTKFQLGKAQAFAQEQPQNQQSPFMLIDQISSIQERPLQTQEDDYIEQTEGPQQLPSVPIAPLPKIQLFCESRPQRLKQLVLNQKGIIYEQSDELSSLPSTRTHRLRNLQCHQE